MIRGKHIAPVPPSMRPPHEAGEVCPSSRAGVPALDPSMRPPHEAGEVITIVLSRLRDSDSFNEAPARGGGGQPEPEPEYRLGSLQ